MNTIMNDQTNADIFILDRDQTLNVDQRPSTPTPSYLLLHQQRMTITYEIVKTQDQHVVLVHEEPPTDTTNAENEYGILGRFTQDNPVIPDDAFISPDRRFNQKYPVFSDDIFHSPISSYSSSEGYCSGSDWDTDSSWRSNDSMRDDLPTIRNTDPLNLPIPSPRRDSAMKPRTVTA